MLAVGGWRAGVLIGLLQRSHISCLQSDANRADQRDAIVAARYGGLVAAIVSISAPRGADSLAAHHPIGMSTGVFDDVRGVWPRLVVAACEVSTYAVELSALSEDELPGLIEYLAARPRLSFRYVSVHAPVKHRVLDDAVSAHVLNGLPLWVRSIVTHPDVLDEPAVYRGLGTRLVLENMDDRKSNGRTADELAVVFEQLPDAGFCFDVAHACSIDPTMGVAGDLLDRFRSRLRQVHVSSLSGGRHVPLTEDDEGRFASVLDRCRDVPWILEARPPDRWLEELRSPGLASIGETLTT